MSNGSGDSTRAASLQPQRAGVQFGTFTLDLATGELTRGGRAVRLQNQPARVLSLLVSRPGQLVTREELRRDVVLQTSSVFAGNAGSVGACSTHDSIRRIGLAMALGSSPGAMIGARLLGWVDVRMLKALLATVLGVSALRMWRPS